VENGRFEWVKSLFRVNGLKNKMNLKPKVRINGQMLRKARDTRDTRKILGKSLREVVKEVEQAAKEGRLKSRTLEELEHVVVLVCDIRQVQSIFGSRVEVIGWQEGPIKIVIKEKPFTEELLQINQKSLPSWTVFYRE